MFDVLYTIASFGFLFWIVRNIFFWGKLLQEHGYSLRTIKRFVTSRSGGRMLLFSPLSLLKWGIIFAYPIIIFEEAFEPYYHLLITALYLTEAVFVFASIRKRQFLRLRSFAPKTVAIVGITLLLIIIVSLFAPIDKYLWIVLLDRGTVFLMLLLLVVVSLPEDFYWEYRFLHAAETQQEKDRITILLLGGQEATIMKHILYQALCERFSVLTTPDQPDFRSVIRTVENNLDTSPDVFLTEFHTDSLSELRQIAYLLSPRFVVIAGLPSGGTGTLREISDSLSVFLKNRKRLKPELYVTPDAVRMAHGIRSSSRDSTILRAGRIKAQVLRPDRLSLKPSLTVFWVRQKGKMYTIETTLSTAHSAHLLLPVTAVLSEVGYAPDDVTRHLETTVLPHDFLHFSQKEGRQLLNHTAETDPRILQDFSDYLVLFRKKRILILDADILAGKDRKGEMIALGKTLSRQFQYIFLIKSPAERSLRHGIQAGDKHCIVVSAEAARIADFLKLLTEKGDFLLFYGPRSAAVFTAYLSLQIR